MIGTVTKALKKVFGDKSTKDMKAVSPQIDKVHEEFEKLSGKSNDDLRAITADLKAEIKAFTQEEEEKIAQLKEKAENDQSLDDEQKQGIYDEVDALTKKLDEKLEEVLKKILPKAFAVVKETARRFTENKELRVTATEMDRDIAAARSGVEISGSEAVWSNTWMAGGNEVTWNMIHYDVQLIGGIVLHDGKIAEMQTGEGKTLVATLPVYLNALTGKGVHLITVNNYLAKRDAEWMGPLFEFHGLTVDVIDNHTPNSAERRKAYKSDIVYGTNNEFGFDYLRDNMAINPDNLVQKKHHYAIIDEVDSVLIDDARTPLIISGPTPKGDLHEFNELKPKIQKLYSSQRQLVQTLLADAKTGLKELDADKPDKKKIEAAGLALFRCYRGLPRHKALIKFLSEPGIKSQMLKVEAFYLQDQGKKMPEVDEELFFTIDEKNNGIELSEKGVDLISGQEDPEFYIMPDIGSKIVELETSGLDDKELLVKKDELMRDYSIKSERIHTINQLLKAYTLFEKDVDYVVMDNKVKIVDEQTGRIMEGRRYSDGLHQAIESKENCKIEAATQTYATITLQNYFRMYHKLAGMTGTAETEAGEFWDIYELDVVVIPTNRPIQRDDREDLVYKTKREKYSAIIEEILEMKSNGRPVLVGTTNVEVSELLSKMLKMKNIDHQVLNAKLHQREADIVQEAGKPGTVTIATNMAGRGTDIKLGEGVKESGGLAIIGTERHDSRRVDRQLRGRAGRQGDPGSSQFFVSLEDNLMRLFGSDRIAKMMDRIGLQDGEVIQHSMITKSIERAQKKVEENNFGIRKRLLEYDDVMNAQREVIYKRRKNALHGERMSVDIANLFYDEAEALCNEFIEAKDWENFELELLRIFSIAPPFTEEEFNSGNLETITDKVYDAARENYKRKSGVLARKAWPIIKDVYENQSDQYKNIVVPFTDGFKTMNVVANLERSYNSEGRELISEVEKGVTLSMIDNSWKEHLREMDDLRQSVQNARYEQKDPLLIYKFESFDLFKLMIHKINNEIASFLLKSTIPLNVNAQTSNTRESNKDLERAKISRTQMPGFSGGSTSTQGAPQEAPKKLAPVRVEKKVGRNEPCPCGSGKKYKQCHGRPQASA
ncbi:MAG: preprotein translocase subunit SecA [Flavobacteriales bacterium]|nr:preprotein translocase subunit SecA [Flavobacteriales bacterium]